jgi:hypothetical protein
MTFTFYVNGQKAGEVSQGLSQDQLNKWTGWSEPKNPFGQEDGMQPKYGFLFRDEVMPRLKKGTNDVRMVLGYSVTHSNKTYTNKKPLTEGTMKIHMEADYKKTLEAPPAAVMSDASLEKQIAQALTNRWGNSTFKRVILTHKNWEVEYNGVGVPLRKVLTVHTISTPKSGPTRNDCFVDKFQVQKKYLGGNKYSDEILWYSSGGSYQTDCE